MPQLTEKQEQLIYAHAEVLWEMVWWDMQDSGYYPLHSYPLSEQLELHGLAYVTESTPAGVHMRPTQLLRDHAELLYQVACLQADAVAKPAYTQFEVKQMILKPWVPAPRPDSVDQES